MSRGWVCLLPGDGNPLFCNIEIHGFSPFLVGTNSASSEKIMKMKVYQSIFNFNEIKINKVKIKTIWLRLTRILKFWKIKSTKDELGQNIYQPTFWEIFPGSALWPRETASAISDDQVRAPRRPFTLTLCLLKNDWSNLSSLMNNWLKIDEKKPPFAYTPKLMYASASTLS